jgi:hypothetical protein
LNGKSFKNRATEVIILVVTDAFVHADEIFQILGK